MQELKKRGNPKVLNILNIPRELWVIGTEHKGEADKQSNRKKEKKG